MSSPRLSSFSLSRRRRQSGFTFVEIAVAATLSVVLAAMLIGALLSVQRFSAASRVMTNARVIVQRNIETALGVKYTSVVTPAILAETEEEGEPFGDYSDSDDSLGDADSPLPIHIDREGDTVISGTLTRTVLPYPSTVSGLVVLQVTFRIDYEFNGRPYSYSMSTLRARDDQ